MAQPTSMVVVWNTNVSAEGTLRYGRYPGPNWEFLQTAPSSTIHAMTLKNLSPDTRYYYEVQSGGTVLASGSDYSFTTYPLSGSAKPFRFAAFGDSGNGSQKQAEMVSQMKALRPQPELTLGLGDLVYSNGEWENYDPRYFGPNADILRSQVLWPSMGNHDSYTENGAPYLANFYLPTDSGAPGAPSNTELYYSFDYGEAHFVAIDSQISSKSIGGPMHDWLRADLADADARGMRWKVIFAHHPPYTYGTHNSDYELDLVFLRQNFTPLMDEFNVDLFLAGHSHVYERSYLVQDDAILQTQMNEYSKINNPEGTMYIVSGAAAKDGSGSLNHPLMSFSKGDVSGASVFDVTH
ncbi:MAG: metallophosphoesterase family protein, partial [Planctomycetota bacterium]|nr:metallophosphoesterase family protein [Planctomycetota bacterium]